VARVKSLRYLRAVRALEYAEAEVYYGWWGEAFRTVRWMSFWAGLAFFSIVALSVVPMLAALFFFHLEVVSFCRHTLRLRRVLGCWPWDVAQ
jgi:hypothetical protein